MDIDYSRILAIAVATGLLGVWRGWKEYRNNLPDDMRSEIFWNDRRYEALKKAMAAAWKVYFWALVVVSAIVALFIFEIVPPEWVFGP
ncbi:hypothetical protein EUU23_06165 [Sphingorhabdus sp. IMCC26285]|jgi:hypothetical protein|uniref:Uncharacterized protein n=1 Tax=Sphingorhabdus profundilacus TaxID=2509718 RepID=A0A6I4M426_9SPHN|nr:hypothetical protein [Sphingorhabdus profundilacus]MVZ97288.1 hypothetical protein [Sphingorhabdus profundilacus]